MDEIYTLHIAPLPWPQMSQMIDQSDNGKPPIYNLFMHEWLRLGDSEFTARLPSAIFGAATCLVAGLLGVYFLGARGWIVGLLLAFSPFHIWYSQETRLYTLLGLFSSVAFYFHCRYCRSGSFFELALFVLFGVLTCYTFPYGFLILAATAGFAFFYRPRLAIRQMGLDAAAHIFVFGSFVPWIPRMLHAAMTTSQPHKGRDLQVLAYSFNNLFFGSSIGVAPTQLHQAGSLFGEHPVSGVILLLAFVTSILVFFSGMKILWEENWNAFVFCGVGIAVFLGGPFVLSLIKPTITNNPRYAFIAVLPALVAVSAFILKVVERPTVYSRLLACFLFAGITISLFDYYYVDAYSRDNVRAAAREIEKNKNVDVIFICNVCEVPTLAHYYHGPAQIIPVNYAPDMSAEAESQWVKDHAGGAQHPVLVYLRPDLGDPQHQLPPLFQSLFTPVDSQQWTGVTLYEYQAGKSSSL